MALVIIGGLKDSTLLILFVVPYIYELFYRDKKESKTIQEVKEVRD